MPITADFSGKQHPAGFTLIELIAVIAVIIVLAVVSFVAYQKLIVRADAVQCMANMKSLHSSLASYVQSKQQWPQPPQELNEPGMEDPLEDWWIETLLPYGATVATWQCPTVGRTLNRSDKVERPRIHYAPTPFDAGELTPYRWSNQPWLVELGNIHGNGAYILFPDGSIRVMNDIVPPQHR
jgi:type II secretory pathway pseudopilin PulG